MSWYTATINNKSYILRVGPDPLILEAPVCSYDTDEVIDIRVENKNNVVVSVYIDGEYQVTLAAGGLSYYQVSSFETYYDVQFEYNGQWSPITTAYSGYYRS